MAIGVARLGAPGVYLGPPAPARALTGVRMDVCAFVGVAPRGPARVRTPTAHRGAAARIRRARSRTPARPTPAARSVAGRGRELGRVRAPVRRASRARVCCPTRSPSFFEQGGRRAYVVRIVHEFPAARVAARRAGARPSAGCVASWSTASGGACSSAPGTRERGATGSACACRSRLRPLPARAGRPPTGVVVSPGAAPRAGTLLRLRLPGGALELRIVGRASTCNRIRSWR